MSTKYSSFDISLSYSLSYFPPHPIKVLGVFTRLNAPLEIALDQENQSAIGKIQAPIDRLVSFYEHMQELARGYVKDPQKLEEQLGIIHGWQDDADQLKASLTS